MTSTHSFEKPNLANLESLLQSPAVSKQEKQAFKSYKDKIDEKTGYVRVDYEVKTFGRYLGYAKKGKGKNASNTYTTGTSMKRVLRNLLFGDEYDDLDIVNCSGSIMCQLFQKHGLPTEKMTYLNDNREDVLKMIMDFHEQKLERMTAKDILIEVFFCGSGHSSQYWEFNPFTNKRQTIIRYALPPFVEELKKEYLHNLNLIVELPEYKNILDNTISKAKEKEKEAWIGQFASELYQDEERKVLEVIVEEIKKISTDRKIDKAIGSLIYDGLHTKKTLEIRNYIKRLEKTIVKKTDYDLKLEIKDMEVSDEEKKTFLGETPPELTYEAKREKFEKTRFKTIKGKHPFHTIDMKEGIISRPKSDFTTAYEDWIQDGFAFLRDWFADPNKRCYEEIEYSCVAEEDKQDDIYYAFPTLRYKTLTSTSTEEEKKDNIAHFEDYLLLLSEDNPAYVRWTRNWIADCVINPHDKGKQPVAVIWWGKQGSGKTTVRVLMSKLFGRKLVHHTTDPTLNGDIFHDFNSSLKFKLFIEFEEINMKIHSQVVERMKGLVTNHTHTITHKGQDPVDVRATERTCFTTNVASSAVIEKGDRRYEAYAISNRRVGDTTYWNDYYKRMDDDNYIRDIADYLLSFKEEVSTYAFRDERPITTYYKSLQQLSLAPELDFLKDTFFYNLEDVNEFKSQENDKLYNIPSALLSNQYNNWRDSHGLKERVSSKSFTMKMKAIADEYGIEHRVLSTSSVFAIDTDILRKSLIRDFNIQEEKEQPLLINLSRPPRIINPHDEKTDE
jgi:hypothetical protein